MAISGHIRMLTGYFYDATKEVQKQSPEVFYKKKVFLEISQNSHKNICARDSITGIFL